MARLSHPSLSGPDTKKETFFAAFLSQWTMSVSFLVFGLFSGAIGL